MCISTLSFLDLSGAWLEILSWLHATLFTKKSESTSLLISVSFWLIYTYQSRVSTFQKLPLSKLLRYCSSWAFDFLTIMSVIQVANQIIMFLTPTYILDHILGFVGEVLVKHTKNNKKNSKQKTLFYKKGSQECTCISCGSFLRENFCRLGSSTIIWKENLSICLLQRRRCLLQFLQKSLQIDFCHFTEVCKLCYLSSS